MSRRPQLSRGLFNRSRDFLGTNDFHDRPSQEVEQVVSIVFFWLVTVVRTGFNHEDFHPQLSSCRSGLGQPIGMKPGMSHDAIRLLLHRLTHEVFQLTGLVSPEGQSRLIVALDQEARSAEGRGQTWQLFPWRISCR